MHSDTDTFAASSMATVGVYGGLGGGGGGGGGGGIDESRVGCESGDYISRKHAFLPKQPPPSFPDEGAKTTNTALSNCAPFWNVSTDNVMNSSAATSAASSVVGSPFRNAVTAHATNTNSDTETFATSVATVGVSDQEIPPPSNLNIDSESFY